MGLWCPPRPSELLPPQPVLAVTSGDPRPVTGELGFWLPHGRAVTMETEGSLEYDPAEGVWKVLSAKIRQKHKRDAVSDARAHRSWEHDEMP